MAWIPVRKAQVLRPNQVAFNENGSQANAYLAALFGRNIASVIIAKSLLEENIYELIVTVINI